MAKKRDGSSKNGASATSNVTRQSAFRLSDDTLATIDELKGRLGLTTKSDVVRLAVTRLAQAEAAREQAEARVAQEAARGGKKS